MSMYSIRPDINLLKRVEPIVKSALKKCEKALKPLNKIKFNITTTSDEFITKRMGGTSGFTHNKKTIEIKVNPSARGWPQSLKSTIAHEFNHALRFQLTGKGFENYTLRDTIALEGLGQCFEEEMFGKTPPWAKAISKDKAIRLWKKIMPKLRNKSFDFYSKLFFGKGKEFPLWGGYTISYLIVKKRKEELDLSWKELMKLSSKKLIGNGLK